MHYDYTYAYEYVKPGNDGLRGEMIRAREKNWKKKYVTYPSKYWKIERWE